MCDLLKCFHLSFSLSFILISSFSFFCVGILCLYIQLSFRFDFMYFFFLLSFCVFSNNFFTPFTTLTRVYVPQPLVFSPTLSSLYPFLLSVLKKFHYFLFGCLRCTWWLWIFFVSVSFHVNLCSNILRTVLSLSVSL